MTGKTILAAIAVAVLSLTGAEGFERQKYNFNSDWKLIVGDIEGAEKTSFDDSGWKTVTLPQAFNEDEAFAVDIVDLTDTVVWYRKHFRLDGLNGKKVFIEFEGVRQAGDFYINGHHLGLHENGVMAVGFDLTPYMTDGDNVMAVRVDNDWQYREKSTRSKFQWNDRNFNANYGGIPKNVYLHVTGEVFQTLPLYSDLRTTGVYIYGTDYDIPERKVTVNAESQVINASSEVRKIGYQVMVYDVDGTLLKTFKGKKVSVAPGDTAVVKASSKMSGMHFWSWGYGYLYTVKTALTDAKGSVIDEVSTRAGFRKTRFGEGKIWLNDRVMMVHGYAQRIGDLVWAKANVAEPGMFAESPDEPGLLYQYASRTGWPNGYPDAEQSGSGPAGYPTGERNTPSVWAAENDPCPEGWRVPSAGEMTALVGTDSQTRFSWKEPASSGFGIPGVMCGPDKSTASSASMTDMSGCVFVPCSGNRSWKNGLYQNPGHVTMTTATYKSSNGGNAYAYVVKIMGSDTNFALPSSPEDKWGYGELNMAYSVRCVADVTE